MVSFIGRNDELSKLESVFRDNIRNCFIETSPRNGSTALVKKFCEKHKSIFVSFREAAVSEAYSAFIMAIEAYMREPIILDELNFETLFQALSKAVKGSDPVVIFEGTENVNDNFSKSLKTFSDNHNVMIILIGCKDTKEYDITFSEKFTLEGLSLRECFQMHPKITAMDNLKTYMTVGNKPLYHAMMNKSDYATSVEKMFLGNCPKLTMECENILRSSSVPYPICCSILSDIANCIGRPVEIASKEGISRQLCDIYLKKMAEERLVRTLVPIGNSPKKPTYIIDNPLMAFYFIVIRMNPRLQYDEKSDIKSIENHIDMFMELRFRDICEEYLKRNYNCIKIGRWWTRDEDTNKPTLAAIIDINGEQKTIIADCKFRSSKIDQGALKAFINRASLIEDVPEISLMMIASSGFEDKLVKKAKSENVVLVGLDELI